MPDSLYTLLRLSLPPELGDVLFESIGHLEQGRFKQVLEHPLARRLYGHRDEQITEPLRSFTAESGNWSDFIFDNASQLLARRSTTNERLSDSPAFRQHFLFLIAVAALQAFVQSNVTGPPLPFDPPTVLFPQSIIRDVHSWRAVKESLIASLSVDGVAAFKLTPNIELFCLADSLLICPAIKKHIPAAKWASLRQGFIHQRLLSEVAGTLQSSIYDELPLVEQLLNTYSNERVFKEMYSDFLLEQVTIHLHHGLENRAREVINLTSRKRKFQFALTGSLGKRTKYQEQDLSQLVVLAKSYDVVPDSLRGGSKSMKPDTVELNDDTLLDTISFSYKSDLMPGTLNDNSNPMLLTDLDPGNQPMLHPQDSIVLLLLASSITNTSPADGLTREETLPYALRVLEGGSSNWQIYSQALLVRSRIEGYKSRTTERGLLQLQALVDQVIADTTSEGPIHGDSSDTGNVSTFLPRAKSSDAAPAQDRLRYVYQLCSPARWELEAELAARWVSLGGLRTALEIYERLQMWPEAALCWAATDREDKAKRIVRRQLFHATGGADDDIDLESEQWEGQPRSPTPVDAPRLYCILGDLDNNVELWERAWEVSNKRYARAQRTIGRHFYAARNYAKAADAYSKALKVNQLNQASWFALGCCLLELEEYQRAVETFTRVVQLDDTDAEAWSNLAAALLRIDESPQDANAVMPDPDVIGLEERAPVSNAQQNRRDALQSFKRAAILKRDNARIWDNVLTVAASLRPPAYLDVINAQRRIIELRAATEGEACVDVAILDYLVRHVVSTTTSEASGANPNEPEYGLTRLVCELVFERIIPLITTSARLWRIVGTLALWRQHPAQALQAHEKAWRAATAQPGWEAGTKDQWDEVAGATEELVDAYESLGLRSSEVDEALVAKDWKFKARSALRGIMGKGKGSWEGTAAWNRLAERLDGLRAGT